MHKTDAVRRPGQATGGLWASAVANLLLGVVAIVPGWFLWWWATHPTTNCDASGCDQKTSAHAAEALLGAAGSGALLLALAFVVDVLMPRQEAWRIQPWLAMTMLIPVPFALTWPRAGSRDPPRAHRRAR
ncbi:hypothetical protein G3I60_04480 [Streptomyces sp. SID13666]|uniref:hypothetical protein n=1 Tax=unclassified Streptomyces TaxID=2593676 RepID=UPI0013BEBC11|nr:MULTISPECIES: hypothetical protein [unclassified Streptomyces]NEA53437.1 hypothetical protein [Streptomyces sp. SID13666]NEA69239.1 hypothetical protein [Streptomyces sp. SID13588]